jgi:hypothetical protein
MDDKTWQPAAIDSGAALRSLHSRSNPYCLRRSRIDDYDWLREEIPTWSATSKPKTPTDAMLRPTEPFQESLYQKCSLASSKPI